MKLLLAVLLVCLAGLGLYAICTVLEARHSVLVTVCSLVGIGMVYLGEMLDWDPWFERWKTWWGIA